MLLKPGNSYYKHQKPCVSVKLSGKLSKIYNCAPTIHICIGLNLLYRNNAYVFTQSSILRGFLGCLTQHLALAMYSIHPFSIPHITGNSRHKDGGTLDRVPSHRRSQSHWKCQSAINTMHVLGLAEETGVPGPWGEHANFAHTGGRHFKLFMIKTIKNIKEVNIIKKHKRIVSPLAGCR